MGFSPSSKYTMHPAGPSGRVTLKINSADEPFMGILLKCHLTLRPANQVVFTLENYGI